MFCQKCGQGIPQDCRFCPECGAEQAPGGFNGPVKMRYTSGNAGNRQSALNPEDAAKIEKQNKMVAYVVAGTLALCFVIGLASIYIKPTIDLNKYLTVYFEGYDTVGKAVVDFDTEQFTEDYGRKLSAKTSRRPQGLSRLLIRKHSGYNDPEDTVKNFLSYCVNGALDVNNRLSNGDTVTYTWDCDYDYALEIYGYKLKFDNVEYTVSNLEEAEEFDPFEGIDIFVEGISPNGSAGIVGQPLALPAENFRYDLDRYYDLSNGDTVTVTASVYYHDDPIEYCIMNYGMVPSSLSKTYTIDGLYSYIDSIGDVSDDALKRMRSQAEEIYKSNVADDWDEDETLVGLTYIGNYLLTIKDDGDYWGNQNALYLVYKAQVHNEYSNGDDVYNTTNDIYWYIAYRDILVSPEGETEVDLSNYRTPDDRFKIDSGIGRGWWSTRSWYYYGYRTLEKLYECVVTDNSDSYNHEDNVDESADTVKAESVGVDVREAGIIFPNSSKELLRREQAEELSDEDLRYAINELYARHGYIFNDETLREYYEKYDWYVRKVTPENFTMDLFNEVEKENVQMLQSERDSRS